jgi:hypothetical protein
MKHEMQRSGHSNPLNSNPGMGNSMTPSPSSEPLKGGVNHAGTPELTTRSNGTVLEDTEVPDDDSEVTTVPFGRKSA